MKRKVDEKEEEKEGGKKKKETGTEEEGIDRKVALVTGITGQDGSYLAELLLEKGYTVHGIVRRSSCFNTGRINHLYADRHETHVKLFLHYGDLCDATNLISIISSVKPTEIYNLGAMSHVKVSFAMPEYTADADGVGVLRMLDAIRTAGLEKSVKFYQASTSELYGKVQEVPQKETTPFYPRSPYAVAKMYAYWILVNYREAYGMHLTNGILFNHESPRRGRTFVTRKITVAVAKIFLKKQKCLFLGNLDSKRDWGHARDYVEGMWMMLQQETPDDYVLATGKTTSVRDFVEKAFAVVGMEVKWKGERGTVDETGVVGEGDDERTIISVDPEYFRPTEVELLIGDPTKVKEKIGWTAKTTLDELVKEMVDYDLAIEKGIKIDADHIQDAN